MVSQSGVRDWDAEVHSHVQLCVRVDLNLLLKLYTSHFEFKFILYIIYRLIVQLHLQSRSDPTTSCLRRDPWHQRLLKRFGKGLVKLVVAHAS